MAKKYLMTWMAPTRRWVKKFKGKMYFVSCRQLGIEDENKEASADAANDWWRAKQKELESAPPTEAEVRANAIKVWSMVQDWGMLDEAAREKLVDGILGEGQYQKLKQQAAAIEEQVHAPLPGRSIREQVETWKKLLLAICGAGQMSAGRYDAYCRNIEPFADWAGPDAAIDTIDEAKLEGYFTHLSVQVTTGKYSANYAHTLLMTAKQFVSRLAEQKLIPLPGNIRSRRLRFNHSAPKKVETFSTEEVRALLSACDGFSERTKLFLLLMLNCGMYQNDIAELTKEEVDWSKGTIRRARSKTRERNGPVVTYKLWPETFALLKRYRAKTGELALTTNKGKPLVRYWLENGRQRRYDVIQAVWTQLADKLGVAKIRLAMKYLRKTSASLLASHPHYKFYANHFLADSPRSVADRHYVVPSDPEFFEALAWLRGQILAIGSQPCVQGVPEQERQDQP
ncbi:MAG TPA: tyrosine-type recombinase/integrase [Gemmataceae bacterium]